jgi:hypothetical protein
MSKAARQSRAGSADAAGFTAAAVDAINVWLHEAVMIRSTPPAVDDLYPGR